MSVTLEDAGAGIDDDQLIVVGSDLDAGGVAAITGSLWPRRRDGASDAPESDFHALTLQLGKDFGFFEQGRQIACRCNDHHPPLSVTSGLASRVEDCTSLP